jgi:hypothetical protein
MAIPNLALRPQWRAQRQLRSASWHPAGAAKRPSLAPVQHGPIELFPIHSPTKVGVAREGAQLSPVTGAGGPARRELVCRLFAPPDRRSPSRRSNSERLARPGRRPWRAVPAGPRMTRTVRLGAALLATGLLAGCASYVHTPFLPSGETARPARLGADLGTFDYLNRRPQPMYSSWTKTPTIGPRTWPFVRSAPMGSPATWSPLATTKASVPAPSRWSSCCRSGACSPRVGCGQGHAGLSLQHHG